MIMLTFDREDRLIIIEEGIIRLLCSLLHWMKYKTELKEKNN